MRRSNFSHKAVTIPASSMTVVSITGNFLIITEASGAFEIGFNAGERFPLELGFSLRMPESDPFTAIYLTNPSSADALTIEFLVGTGTVDIVDSRLNVIAARPDVSLLPVGAWKRKQVSLSAGATAAFFASATYGQNAILMAPIGNPNPISAGPTAADKDLIVLDPGASYQVNTGDAMRYNLALWYAYNSGAGACTLEILYV